MTTDARVGLFAAIVAMMVLVAGSVGQAAPPADDTADPAASTGSAGGGSATAAEGSGAVVEPPPLEPAPAAPPPSNTHTFTGSVQFDYLAVPTDHDARQTTLDGATVELSLKVTKEFGSHTTVSVKACFACHGFEIGMAYIELRAADELRLRVGRMTPSFGSFPLRHDPANHLTSDKPLPYDMGRMLRRNEWNEGILPAPWVDNGIELAGTHFGRNSQIDYAVWAVSGPKGSPDAADFDFTLSRAPEQYYVDNNSEPVFGGRGSVSRDVSDDVVVAAGVSAMAGHYDPDRRLSFSIAEADVVVKLGSIYLRAEYLIRRTEMALGDPSTRFKYGPGPGGRYSSYFLKDGYSFEGEVPYGRITLIGRLDGLRRVGNVLATSAMSSSSSVVRLTAALAVRLPSKMLFKTSAEIYRFSDYDNDVAIHAGLATAF